MACNGIPDQQVSLERALAECGLVVKDDKVYRPIEEQGANTTHHPVYMNGVYADAGVVSGQVVPVHEAEAQLDYAQK